MIVAHATAAEIDRNCVAVLAQFMKAPRKTHHVKRLVREGSAFVDIALHARREPLQPHADFQRMAVGIEVLEPDIGAAPQLFVEEACPATHLQHITGEIWQRLIHVMRDGEILGKHRHFIQNGIPLKQPDDHTGVEGIFSGFTLEVPSV